MASTSYAMAGRMCAVTGRDCDEAISATSGGQTYYFSSKGAKRLFEMRPGKYTNSGAKQKICPVMGGKIDKKVYTDYKGKRVYFCCPSCIATFKADPHKYMKIINAASNKPKKIKPMVAISRSCSGCPSASSCSSAADGCSDKDTDDDSCSDDSSCSDNSGSSDCSSCSGH